MARYFLRTLAYYPRLTDSEGEVELARFSKQLAILIYLAARPGGRAAREELASMLWESSTDADARRSLRQIVYELRRSTDQQLVTGEQVLTLDRDRLEFDVDLFRRHLAAGRGEAALALYEGDFLAHVGLSGARDFEEWTDGVRRQLAAERRQLLRSLTTGASDAGDWGRAAHWAELLIEADTNDLKSRFKLIELLALAGDVVRAGAAAEEARNLAREIEGRLAPAVETSIQRALAPTVAPERRQPGFPRHPEMVGRSKEFRTVVNIWKRATEGQGGAVLITGEAGIGKTRLAAELERRLRGDRALVLRTSCYALEQSDPLAPFLDLLAEGHAAPGLSGASGSALATLAPFVPELADRFKGAVTPRSLPIPPQALAVSLVEAFAAIAEDAPLVLVVDQLHWSSPATIEFAHRLARRAASCRMLLLLEARDFGGPADTMQALRDFERAEAVRAINLEPLDITDVEQLMGSIAGLPEGPTASDFTRRLTERTAGIPLFVLEALKALYDAGRVAVDGGSWVLSEELLNASRPLPVPESAGAILKSRLEMIGTGPLAVLAALAVRARQTTGAELVQMTGLAEDEVREAIDALQRRRLVGRPEGVPAVAHDELGTAAVAALVPAELALLHGRAAALAEARASAGNPGEWAAAAQHAAAAGQVDRAALFAVRAAAAVERASGREAAGSALARLVESAPAAARPSLHSQVERVLAGRWTARRWLAEREGRFRWRVVAATAAAAALLTVGGLVLARALRSSPPPPLGGGYLAVGRGPAGGADSVEAWRLDSAFALHRVVRDSLPPGVRDGYDARAVRADFRAAAVRCTVRGATAAAVCARDLATGDTVPLAWYDVGADPVGWLPGGTAFVMLGWYLRPDGRPARGLFLADSGGSPKRVIRKDRYDYQAAYLAPAGDRLIAYRSAEDESATALLSADGADWGVIAWCPGLGGVAWARDQQRIACVSEDRRALYLGYPWPDTRPTRVVLSGAITAGPVWSPDGAYLAVLVGEPEAALYVIERTGLAEPRLAARFAGPVRLLGWATGRAEPVVRAIRLRPRSLGLAVGERRPLRVEGFDAGGARLAAAPGVHFTTGDSRVARVSDTGEVEGVRAGTTRIIGALGGAADTVSVEVRAAVARSR